MILRDTALNIINNPGYHIYDDLIEAYQFVNDNGLIDHLRPSQVDLLNYYVEIGVVLSPVEKV